MKNQVLSMVQPTDTPARTDRIRAYMEIIKPRISTMVLFTVWAGSVASGWASSSWEWLHAMIGTLLVAASGSAMNQYLERYSDFSMPRTARRPLPGGRLSAPEVVIFAALCLGVGTGYLLSTVHPVSTALCVATWVLYAFVYTLSKPITVWNTFIGAFPGAMPVLVGAAAFDGRIGPLSWILFSILFLWQFPHFMAIAWKYRSDYAEGGLKMITVTDPSGKSAGWVAVATALLLFPCTLTAVLWLSWPVAYALLSLVLCGIYLNYSWRFLNEPTTVSARGLLLSSLVFLPFQMLTLLICL
jgi:protoheme IX farnesyltransferase